MTDRTKQTYALSDAALSQARQADSLRVSPFLSRRADLRSRTIFTFGYESSSFRQLGVSISQSGGRYSLGIHIIDAAEVAPLGSPLDLAVSELLMLSPDRSLFPAELTNGFCSLKQGTDRLAISVFFDVDSDGNGYVKEICESVVRPVVDCIYDEVDRLFDVFDTSSVLSLKQKYSALGESIDLLYSLGGIAASSRIRENKSISVDMRRYLYRGLDESILDCALIRRPDSCALMDEIIFYASGILGSYLAKNSIAYIGENLRSFSSSALEIINQASSLGEAAPPSENGEYSFLPGRLLFPHRLELSDNEDIQTICRIDKPMMYYTDLYNLHVLKEISRKGLKNNTFSTNDSKKHVLNIANRMNELIAAEHDMLWKMLFTETDSFSILADGKTFTSYVLLPTESQVIIMLENGLFAKLTNVESLESENLPLALQTKCIAARGKMNAVFVPSE